MKKAAVMKVRVVIALAVVFFCSVLFLFRNSVTTMCVTHEPLHEVPVYLRSADLVQSQATRQLQDNLKTQLELATKLLNENRRKIGQLDCEKEENKETNAAGGWCRQSSREDGGQHMTDMPLVKQLSSFFAGKHVGSFGDGPGAYKREILKLGQVKVYDAYDGAPYCEETSEGRVVFMDLTVPQYGVPFYDWILSLEVAEHIPKEYEAVYLDNLVRHAREGIVMSWAVPDQGGLAHINNRPLEYVIKLFEHYGFKHEPEQSKKLQAASSFQWLRQNINVYTRVNKTNLDILEHWFT